MVTNLTTKQIESIQIDESVIFLNYGEEDEQFLAPTRGGGEFAATVTVRDIEFDGKQRVPRLSRNREPRLRLRRFVCRRKTSPALFRVVRLQATREKRSKTRLRALSLCRHTSKMLLCSLKRLAASTRKSRSTTLCTKQALRRKRYRKPRASLRLNFSPTIRIATLTATCGKWRKSHRLPK